VGYYSFAALEVGFDWFRAFGTDLSLRRIQRVFCNPPVAQSLLKMLDLANDMTDYGKYDLLEQ
jgi:hypothetical protein